MTAVLGVVVAGLAVALAVVLLTQRRVGRRLVVAGQRLSEDLAPTGSGLAEAVSVVERAVDRTLERGGQGSVAEARLTRALAVLPLGVVVFDAQGAIVFRNPVAATYLTARHGEALVEEAIGELAQEATVHGDAPARAVDLFGPPRRTVVLTAVRIQEGLGGLGVVVVVDDVTDRRRLEAVRRDFVANISHELKTPVGALSLLADTLLAEDDPAVAKRLADRMLTEAIRVGRTLDDLLELSRIETDEPASLAEVSVQDLISEAVLRVAPAAEQQGITIRVDDAPAAFAVSGDRRQLVSATYNLLENALKYSDRGSSIEVRSSADGRWVAIAVEDHGIGIPRRDLERVFERFYRVDRARSRDTGGTGLGLAIVRHVAGNHAGDVRVESTEGEGSTFTLRVPMAAGLDQP